MAARLKDHYDVLFIGKDGNVALNIRTEFERFNFKESSKVTI